MPKLIPLRSYVTTITPEQAHDYLATSPGNRNYREVRIDELALEITEGRWKLNGDSIKFDQHGKLMDGHHRLLACIKAGKAIETFVIEGLNRKTKPTSGTGAPYSLADNLFERNETNTNELGATLTRLVRFSRLDRNRPSEFASNTLRVSPASALDYLKKNPEVKEDLREAGALKKIVSPSRVTWLLHLAKKSNPEKAQEFIDKLISGADLADGNPILVLRSRFMTEKGNKKSRLSEAEFQAFLIKGWNAHVEGRKVVPRSLAWRREASGNSAPEPFPLPIL